MIFYTPNDCSSNKKNNLQYQCSEVIVKKDLLVKRQEDTSRFTFVYKNAIKRLLNKLIKDRNNEKIYTLLGFCYKKTHKYNKAISYFEKAIMLNQDYFSPYYQMGLCALKINKNCVAVNSFIKAIQTKPTHSHSVLCLGLAHEICEEPDMALMIYERLIETTPNYTKAFEKKAELLINLSSFHDAIQVLNEIIKRTPTNAMAYQKLAKCYKKLGKKAYESRCYRKILTTNSQDEIYANAMTELKRLNRENSQIQHRQKLKLC